MNDREKTEGLIYGMKVLFSILEDAEWEIKYLNDKNDALRECLETAQKKLETVQKGKNNAE